MSTSGRVWKGLASTIRWTPLAAGGLLLLLASVESRAQPPGPKDVSTVRGKVDRFTTAPMGEVDGAVLDSGDWLHWPPHLQDRFTAILSKGDRVEAIGRTETGPAGDTHFEVERITNLRSGETAENPDRANGPPPPPPGRGRRPARADNGDLRTVQGRVERLTTAPRGETDGAVLDDGDLLHWPPHLQDQFTNVVHVGDRVRATGWTETGPAGDTHFEVRSVTNLRTQAAAENSDFANGPPPPRSRAVVRSRPMDQVQRLRYLEDLVEQLRREIQRLRRDR